MIVVIGVPAWTDATDAKPTGRTAQIAMTAAAAGARVEVVGRVGDDQAGDAVLLALAQLGVGHVAVLRDPVQPTPVLEAPVDDDPVLADSAQTEIAPGTMHGTRPSLAAADLDLGLRYLTDFGVAVVADALDDAALAVVVDAASFAAAHLVVVLPSGGSPPRTTGTATVLEPPFEDPDGRFATLVGTYAAALDRGEPPTNAFDEAVRATGAEPAPDD